MGPGCRWCVVAAMRTGFRWCGGEGTCGWGRDVWVGLRCVVLCCSVVCCVVFVVAYTGLLCMGLFTDGQWYRASIEGQSHCDAHFYT